MKKFLTLMLGICLILPCAFMFTGCKDKEPEAKMETWDGTTIAVSVEDADEDGVITIDSAEKLAGFAQAVNAGEDFAENTIRLACDMDMAGRTWTPIGTGYRKKIGEAGKFSGIFDGNGKKIIGLTNGDYTPNEAHTAEEGDITSATVKTYHYGFFGVVTGATIKNLELTVNFNCYNEDYTLMGDSVGGLVGFSSGKLTIDNCKVNGTINGGYDAVGGLVGRAYDSSTEAPISITKSVNNANVTAFYKATGILGFASSGTLNLTIDECINNGTIEAIGINIDVSQTGGITYRYVSMTSGFVLFGVSKTVKNNIVVTNNVNNGNMIVCEDFELAEGRTCEISHTYFAAQVNVVYPENVHYYNFEDNTNNGKVYRNGIEVNGLGAIVKKVFITYDTEEETFSEYSAADDCNGTEFVPTPAE